MTLSNSTTASPGTIDTDAATGSRDRTGLNGQSRAAGEQPAAASALSTLDPPHRPRRVRVEPATPNARQANGRDAQVAAAVEPTSAAVPTNGSAVLVAPGKRRSAAAAASRQAGAAGALDQVESLDTAESEADGQLAADGAPREPLTFAEVQEAHTAAARTFRDIRRALNESYRMIGRLNVERYELQVELSELKGLPMPERPPDRSWNAAAALSAPAAPLAAQRLQRNRPEPDEEEEVDEEKVRAIGRKRQLTLVAIVAVTAIVAMVYRIAGWNWFPNLTDREAMADIAGIGILMQVFFLIFFLFRIGTLTGKGRSWLFPTPEAETFKRRRKRLRGH